MDFKSSEELCFSEWDEMLTMIQEVIDEDEDYIQPNPQIEIQDVVLNHDSNVGPEEFTQKDTSVHRDDTLEDALYFCHVCSKFFKFGKHLRKHLNRSHPGIFAENGCLYKSVRSCKKSSQNYVANLFACRECGKLLKSERTLARHMAQHTKEYTFLCETCGKGFTDAGSLKTHFSIHRGEKQHICDICSKQFRQKAHLNAHFLSVHTDIKPHKCHVCQKNFSQKGNLKQHLKTHSSEDLPYT